MVVRARREVVVGALESRDDGISVSMKRTEAAALAAVAEIGLDAEDAKGRIRRTVTAEHAVIELRRSRGQLALTRPEAAALIAVSEGGLALAGSPRRLFAPVFEAVDLAAAQRGLDQLRGAMR